MNYQGEIQLQMLVWKLLGKSKTSMNYSYIPSANNIWNKVLYATSFHYPDDFHMPNFQAIQDIPVFDDFLSQKRYTCYSFWRCSLNQTSKYIYLLKTINHKSLDLFYWAKWKFCLFFLLFSSSLFNYCVTISFLQSGGDRE